MDRKALLGGLAVGSGIGAGLMFLLDPTLGRRRRGVAGDRAESYLRDAEQVVEKKVRHLGNRARGLAAEARSALGETPAGPVPAEGWDELPRRDETSGLG
jgi:hypothetical protein